MKQEKKHIAFWIIFPILFLLVGALSLFYLDLANGPVILFIIEIVLLVGLAIGRIATHTGKKRWMLLWLVYFAANAAMFPFAKPSAVPFRAYGYKDPKPTEVLTLHDGKVQGLKSQDGKIEVYAGIPYAAAPIGDLRWKEPQDVKPWDGVKDASYFAARSMQPVSSAVIGTLTDIYSAKGWHPNWNMEPLQNRSEDSLYLNVWRPATINEKLPILVFIHGGSLTTGSSAFFEYNGEALARQGIIMITITYRLGVFGYFAHPDLKAESPNGTTGNYGLLDQIKALEWVQENADYFGGDKTKVTIAGESAGSSSISALCTSPLAKGLFRYAIGESSSLVLKHVPHTYRSQEKAYEVGNNILKEFNCNSIEELRKVPAEKLVDTQYSNGQMMKDGYALPRDPYDVYAAGEQNESALLNGYNIKEADAFVIPSNLFSPTNKDNIRSRLASAFNETVADKWMTLYKDAIEKDAFSTYNEIISLFWFIYPHQSWSEMAVKSGEPVYRYQFTKENGFHGTYHAGEMIYAYGNLHNSNKPWAYNQSDYDLSAQMTKYWVNFVKTGNPNGTSLTTWNPYSSKSGKVMELGERVGEKNDPYVEGYKILEEYDAR